MVVRKWAIALSLLMVLSLVSPTLSSGENTSEENSEALWSAVKPLDTITSFLNTGAHPDDERSHLLAYLSRGLGVHTASLIANRGEGGQNEIGEELGNALGIIRSRELMEASKVTGVKVFHLSESTSDEIYDFGFSKSPNETLQKWGEEETYRRFIRRIRIYKPDIVMPSFRNVATQHGHHRAISILSQKAFEDAADPSMFPEQIEEEGLSPWQIKKLYMPAETKEASTVEIEVGGHDAIYGETYPQIGEASRYLHKSQGMGRDIEPGSEVVHLELVKSAVGKIPEHETTIFENLNYNFTDYAANLEKRDKKIRQGLNALQQDLDQVIAAYPSHEAVLNQSHAAMRQLQKVKQRVERAKYKELDKVDLTHRLKVKEVQLEHVSKVASQLEVSIDMDPSILTQGTMSKVEVTLQNNGTTTLKNGLAQLNVPKDWEVKEEAKVESETLAPGEAKTYHFSVLVPATARYYKPYAKSVLSSTVTYEVDRNKVQLDFSPEETIAVLPNVGLKANPVDLMVNTAKEVKESPIEVMITNYTRDAVTAEVSLHVPESWDAVEPQIVAFSKGEKQKKVMFTVKPPQSISKEEFKIKPVARVNGTEVNTSVQEVFYDHIGSSYYLTEAIVKGVAFDLNYPDHLKIGYIDSGFDLVADRLINVGMNVSKISEDELAAGDLSNYDTIITGIRAYLSREDLVTHNDRLLTYAKNGGHLVVQYNKPWDNWDSKLTAPYPLTIGQPSIKWRVTDEHSDYQIHNPAHTFWNNPNTITDKDWEGWVQERGLYFPMAWDNHYETLLTMTDLDGDSFNGGILLTEFGKGSYVYTNLVWYRQIQNQVPGGYRIFANVVSYPAYQ